MESGPDAVVAIPPITDVIVPPINDRASNWIKLFSLVVVLSSFASSSAAAFIAHPSTGTINKEYLTYATPSNYMIGFYWVTVFLLQLGYVVLIVVSTNHVTQRTVVDAVGIRYILATGIYALWPIFWGTRLFQASGIVLLLVAGLLITLVVSLLNYPPCRERFYDFLFIHIPIRLFLLVIWNVAFWQNGAVIIGLHQYVAPNSGTQNDPWSKEDAAKSAFVGIYVAIGMINAIIVYLSGDVVWALGTIYLFIAIIVGPAPRQPWHIAPLIFFLILQVVALLASYAQTFFGMYRAHTVAKIVIEEPGEAAPPHAEN